MTAGAAQATDRSRAEAEVTAAVTARARSWTRKAAGRRSDDGQRCRQRSGTAGRLEQPREMWNEAAGAASYTEWSTCRLPASCLAPNLALHLALHLALQPRQTNAPYSV